jgi:hypothetical protein
VLVWGPKDSHSLAACRLPLAAFRLALCCSALRGPFAWLARLLSAVPQPQPSLISDQRPVSLRVRLAPTRPPNAPACPSSHHCTEKRPCVHPAARSAHPTCPRPPAPTPTPTTSFTSTSTSHPLPSLSSATIQQTHRQSNSSLPAAPTSRLAAPATTAPPAPAKPLATHSRPQDVILPVRLRLRPWGVSRVASEWRCLVCLSA